MEFHSIFGFIWHLDDIYYHFYEALDLLHVNDGIWTLEAFLLGCSSLVDVVHTYGRLLYYMLFEWGIP